MRSVIRYLCTLFILAGQGAKAETAQEMIRCGQPLGASKTGCETPIPVAQNSIAMHYAITYDYICKYNFTTSVPVLTPGPIIEHPNENYHFVQGVNRLVEVPEAKELLFRFSTSQQPVLHKDCSLKITSIQSRPSNSTVDLWTAEAKRLTQLLDVRSKSYRHILDVNRLIDDYSLVKLDAMGRDLQRIFASTVELGLTRKDSVPPGPPKPGSSKSKSPSDYGLPFASWQELDVKALGIVIRKPGEARFDIVLDSSDPKQRWYFDAKSTLPVVSALLSQIAIVASASLFKEQAQEAGFELPDAATALDELSALILEAKQFLNTVQLHKALLIEAIDNLNAKVVEATPAPGSQENTP